jgi:hypothetical protein
MKRAIFTTWFVVCAALPALTAELEFSANGEAEYDDNVFRGNQHKEDDVLFRLRPGVRIHEDRGDDLNFSAGYEAPVEFSIHNSSELNDVDHVGHGLFNYHVNDRVEVFGSENYGYLRSTLRQQTGGTDVLGLAGGFTQLNDQRDRVTTNSASLGAAYRFSPRTVARVAADSNFFDSSRPDRARVYSVGGQADLNYRLTLKHQLGAGAGYSYQDFGERQDISGSHTNTYRLFGTWRWLLSQTLSFELTAGPAYLETKQDDASRLRVVQAVPFTVLPAAFVPSGSGFFRKDGATPFTGPIGAGSLLVSSFNVLNSSQPNCASVNGFPVASGCGGNIILDVTTDPATVSSVLANRVPIVNMNARGRTDNEITGFVDAVLTQQWTPTLATALRYSREQGDGSGVGGTVIVDAASLSNTWNFAQRWQLALRGDYVRRESAFDIAQTFDIVAAQALPGGSVPVASRDNGTGAGLAFNSTRNVTVDTDSWSVAGRITHDLFKTTSIYAQVRYSEQNSKSSSLGAASDFEDFLATFGVRHVFEPIPLW